MKRPVRWSRDALNDLREQVVYIAADNPPASRTVASKIRKAAAALGDMATGRPGRTAGIYEKTVAGLSYIIAYAISYDLRGESIVILRVIHTSRDWPPGEWPE